MKNLKVLLLMVMASLLLLTTGCQSLSDILGLGNGGDEEPIEIDNDVDVIVDENATGDWSEPNEPVSSQDTWEPIAGVTFTFNIFFRTIKRFWGLVKSVNLIK